MNEAKDNFSERADLYAKYRPGYPKELYAFLYSLVADKSTAWDCGTGSGQVATILADEFKKVCATDISEKQLLHAVKKDNIFYSLESAEHTSFPDNYFDLVVVAQAIHWFDFELFYKELLRTIKPAGVFAVLGYGLVRINHDIDKVVDQFYRQVIGPYWDKERRFIDEHYQTIPFPFNEIDAPRFTNNFEWTLENFLGYISTWSAVQHYKKAINEDPVQVIQAELEMLWAPTILKTVHFPILLRVAKIDKGDMS